MKKIWIKSATLQDFAAIEVGDWIEGVGMIMSHFEKGFVRRFGACHKTSASTMDEKKAKELVRKLTNAAYEAGMHYNSTMKENWQKKAVKIGDEVVRHLTSVTSRATECCPDAGEVCVGPCNLVKPLPEASTRPDKLCAVCGGLRNQDELTVCNQCGETISGR